MGLGRASFSQVRPQEEKDLPTATQLASGGAWTGTQGWLPGCCCFHSIDFKQLMFLGITSWYVGFLFITLKTLGRAMLQNQIKLSLSQVLSISSTCVFQASNFIFLSLSSCICKMGVLASISKCSNENYMSQKQKTPNTVLSIYRLKLRKHPLFPLPPSLLPALRGDTSPCCRI